MADSIDSIQSELKKKTPDLIKVQELLYKLQDETDKDSVRFRVNGSLINRLGAELVERKETAICELIKNSYDADSKLVDVIFDLTPKRQSISIEDFGGGMTRDEISHGFMIIGTDNKVDRPKSPVLGRRRAGSKGIGRLAGYRLGKVLTIETKSKKEITAYKVTIDWTQFEEESDISFVRIPIEEGSFRDKGTKLTITNLQDTWDETSIQEVYRYVADLFQPEVVSNEVKIDIDSFNVNFIVRNDGVDFTLPQSKKLLFDYAHAEIDAYVTASGKHTIKYKSNVYKLKETLEGDTKFPNLRGVYFKAYYFLHGKAGLLKGLNKAKVKEMLDQERFGIRVYRNGFRVLPFGEPQNDWLSLDKGEAKRAILIPAGNKNFFGFISINDPDNIFTETSNREGFVQNEIFNDLVTFGKESCYKVGADIGKQRGKKIYATQKNFKSGASGSPDVKLADIENKLSALLTSEVLKGENAPKSENAIKVMEERVQQHVAAAIRRVKDEHITPQRQYSESLLEENSMLRVLATLGISVAEFTHEIRIFAPSFENDIENLSDIIKDATARVILSRMKNNVIGLNDYVGFFDNTVIQNSDRTRTVQKVSDIATEFKSKMDTDLERSSIQMKLNLEDDVESIPMHYSEWTSILFNFYSNAKKAIKRGKVTKGEIFIATYRERKNVVLEFHDNGSGIEEKVRKDIFDAFVTTSKISSVRKKRSGDISGSGLGLWIVRQIVESYGGDVRLAPAKKGFNTCFKVSIPENG